MKDMAVTDRRRVDASTKGSQMKKPRYRVAAALALCMMAATGAHAHGPAGGADPQEASMLPREEKAFGIQGDLKKIARTIAIDMKDTMRFGPTDLRIRQGETVRFVIRNKGSMMHELVLGTLDELKQHGELMKRFPDMEHDEPYMAHVAPGKKEQMVWQFTRPGEFHYACLIPGHFEAGMVGRITVTAR
jgi:uncharacterized cupredoxin-like copper-binding protein